MGTTPQLISSGDVLFGQTRRDVLALLLGRPDERFYLREILRAAGGGSGGVQRELKQLVAAGLLHRVREGRQVYFSANRHADIFPELQAIIQKTAGAADLLRAALVPLVHQGKIILAFIHGSIATGEQVAQSDVDIITVGDASLGEVVVALRPVEKRLGREVNPSTYSLKEFQKKARARAHFLARVVAGPKIFITGDADELARLAR